MEQPIQKTSLPKQSTLIVVVALILLAYVVITTIWGGPEKPETEVSQNDESSIQNLIDEQNRPNEVPDAVGEENADANADATNTPAEERESTESLPAFSTPEGPEKPATGSNNQSLLNPALEYLWNVLLVGGLFIGFILLLWLFKRYVPGAQQMFASPLVKVIGRNYLGAKQQIFLVRVGTRRILVVGVSGNEVRTLSEITDPEEVALLAGTAERSEDGSISQGFAGMVKLSRESIRENEDALRELEASQKGEGT
ncbi:MAG: flagellar biosynthetic protein FliO [Planctomycetes bacterium]|nr:flagellar biosynthetic protein FliO [Planctomycetota bacterium]